VEKGRRVDSFYVDFCGGVGECGERVRRDLLTDNMLRHVEREHGKFLESIGVVVPEHVVELRSWHPKFDLERVADPISDIGGNGDSKEKVKETEKVPEMIKQAIASAVADKGQSGVGACENKTDTKGTTDPTDTKDPTATDKKKLTLRERIRLKEQQADLAKMTGPTPSTNKALLSSLPALIDRLSFLFSSSHKSALPLSHIHSALQNSNIQAAWSEREVDERLDVLVERCGEWIRVERGERPVMVRVDKRVSIREMKERIERLLVR
jgi:hypothetical protein